MLSAFLSLFPNRWAYIYKPLTGHGWLSANDQWKLTDTEILKAAAGAHTKFFLGLRAGKTTKFVILDIDTKSQYHTSKQLKRIVKTLQSAGLKNCVLYQSSNSGGWHLYVPFADFIPSKEVHRNVTRLLRLHDFRVEKGQLEVFPNPGQNGSLGYGVRLPLQPGWAWLNLNDQSVDCYREELSAAKAIELFLRDLYDDAPNTLADYDQFKRRLIELESTAQTAKATAINPKPSNVVPFRKPTATIDDAAEILLSSFGFFPPGIRASDWVEGRRYFDDGLTASGQRAQAIFCLSHYLFYGDPERSMPALGYGYEQEREYTIKQILAVKNHNQSKDLNRGRADALAQVTRAANWRPAEKREADIDRYKKAVPIAWVRHNANLKNDARKRIKDAVECFFEAHQPFSQRELAEKAECSRRTLQKHPDLWKVFQEQLQNDHLATGSHEYNAVEGAASQESLPPPTVSKNLMPPGRLAARQIVFEITRRAQKDRSQKKKYLFDIQNTSFGCSSNWRLKVEAAIPKDLGAAAVGDLKVSLILLQKYLSFSPDYESEDWLRQEMEKIRGAFTEHQGRFAGGSDSS